MKTTLVLSLPLALTLFACGHDSKKKAEAPAVQKDAPAEPAPEQSVAPKVEEAAPAAPVVQEPAPAAPATEEPAPAVTPAVEPSPETPAPVVTPAPETPATEEPAPGKKGEQPSDCEEVVVGKGSKAIFIGKGAGKGSSEVFTDAECKVPATAEDAAEAL